ncbi:MAG TPA: putative methyltransferase [Planctomycetes bacterium]|nr:putative methyltransferase [Planctomycetota bacterium]
MHFHIVRALADGPASIWKLLRRTDGPIRHVYAACRELVAGNVIRHEAGQFVLTAGQHPVVAAASRRDFRDVKDQLAPIVRQAPGPAAEYFQERLVLEDLLKRLDFVYQRGDLAGRRLFVLGDDDLFSLAAALTGLPARVTVAEIDQRLVQFIADQAKRRRLEVETLHYNAADPLPKRFRRAFDVFVTDPVETLKGFTTTISRGLAALGHPGTAYFGLTELECPPVRWMAFQRMLHRAGLVLTDILRDHSWYVNEAIDEAELAQTALKREYPFQPLPPQDCLWYRSSFHRAVTVRRPTPPITGRVRFDKSFYSDRWVMTTS